MDRPTWIHSSLHNGPFIALGSKSLQVWNMTQLLYVHCGPWPKQLKTYYGRKGRISGDLVSEVTRTSLDQMVWQAKAGVNCRTSPRKKERSVLKKRSRRIRLSREWSFSTMKFIHSKEIYSPSVTTVRPVFWLKMETNIPISFIKINIHISFSSHTPLGSFQEGKHWILEGISVWKFWRKK